MPKMTLNRDFTLNTTKGHSIEFKKGVPTGVPPALYQDALQIGAVDADGKDPVIEDPKAPKVPVDPAERNPKIAEAIELLIEQNDRTDFTAAGAPKADAVGKLTGWKVSAKEIEAIITARNEKLEAQKLADEQKKANEQK